MTEAREIEGSPSDDPDALLPPREIAAALSQQLGGEVSGSLVRQWFRRKKSPAGALVPDEEVDGVAHLRTSTVALMAVALRTAGWGPGTPNGPRRPSASRVAGWLVPDSTEDRKAALNRAVDLSRTMETYLAEMRKVLPTGPELASLEEVMAAVHLHEDRMTSRAAVPYSDAVDESAPGEATGM